MTASLPPLIRLAVNHHDPFMVALRENLIQQLVQKTQEVLRNDTAVRDALQSSGVSSVMLGGSASLDTPRHPQDIDLYLDGEYTNNDKVTNDKRLQAMRLLLERAAEKLNAKVDHVYVRDEASKAPGLQKITLQAVFAPHGEGEQSLMAATKQPVHMPFKIEVHHEREKLFLPPVELKGHRDAHSLLKAIDPRMVALQKLNRLFDPSDTLKGTDILDIAHLIDEGVFNPSDPLMRKLGIAAMASDGMLRSPVSMDFLIPRNREDEVAILKQDLEVNISRELLAQYSDEQLARMIEKVRQAVRTLYPLKTADESLVKPIFFEDAVSLIEGERQFIEGIFKGKALGAGSPKALIQTKALFNDTQQPHEEVVNRIKQDAGILAEVEHTNQLIRDDSKRQVS
ncbi:MAG: hypothetical protein ACOYNL_08690 [Rickettsiales bacterium]